MPDQLSDRTDDRPRPADGALSVLVVEDQDDAALSTAALLELHGYEVRVAGCGADAIWAVDAEPPDVVLLDIGLPGLDGCEVARRVRRRPGKQPVVVAVTGYARDEDRLRSADAGVDLHLAKPVDPAVLVGMLRRFRRALAPPRGVADATDPDPVPGYWG